MVRETALQEKHLGTSDSLSQICSVHTEGEGTNSSRLFSGLYTLWDMHIDIQKDKLSVKQNVIQTMKRKLNHFNVICGLDIMQINMFLLF